MMRRQWLLVIGAGFVALLAPYVSRYLPGLGAAVAVAVATAVAISLAS